MKRIDVVLPSILLATLLAGGCVEKSQELSSAEREQLSEFVKSERPDPEHELDINFENKIELIGYDIEPDTWTEGEAITVTWHWHAKQALEEGWMLFTHLADASGNNRLNSDGDSVIRRLYQPGRWKAGEYVLDRQTITLPEDWNSPRATFYVGVWNGPHRLQVTEGPNDGENRARPLVVDVEQSGPAEGEAPQPAIPSLRATKTDADITIDGELDEEAWSQTPATGRFVNTMNGGATEPRTTAKVLWDDEHLYVAFEVADTWLASEFDERDAHLWEKDAVELMIDPDGDGEGYFELQVSPKGVLFDTRYESRRQPQPFGHVDWNPAVEANVKARGDVNDDEADQGYVVEMAIPWSAFEVDGEGGDAPTPSSTWRVNFFVVDAQEQGQRAAAWSAPRTGDFHVLDRFGRLVFADSATAAVAPRPAEAPQVNLPPNVLERLRDRAARGGGQQLREAARPTTPRPGEMMPERPAVMQPAAMGTTAMTAPTAMGGTAGDDE